MDTSISDSRPGSFSSAINPSGAPSSARLLQSLPTGATQVHVEFAMLLTPTDGTVEVAALHEVTAAGTTYGLFYREVSGAAAGRAPCAHGRWRLVRPDLAPWARLRRRGRAWTSTSMSPDLEARFVDVQHDGTRRS